MKLYVKNLPWGTTRDDVRERFERYGRVSAVDVRKDSANFEVSATVDMPDAGEARCAMNNLDGAIYKYEEKGEILRVRVSLHDDCEYGTEENDDEYQAYERLTAEYEELKWRIYSLESDCHREHKKYRGVNQRNRAVRDLTSSELSDMTYELQEKVDEMKDDLDGLQDAYDDMKEEEREQKFESRLDEIRDEIRREMRNSHEDNASLISNLESNLESQIRDLEYQLRNL